jgi:hypothetical protein
MHRTENAPHNSTAKGTSSHRKAPETAAMKASDRERAFGTVLGKPFAHSTPARD